MQSEVLDAPSLCPAKMPAGRREHRLAACRQMHVIRNRDARLRQTPPAPRMSASSAMMRTARRRPALAFDRSTSWSAAIAVRSSRTTPSAAQSAASANMRTASAAASLASFRQTAGPPQSGVRFATTVTLPSWLRLAKIRHRDSRSPSLGFAFATTTSSAQTCASRAGSKPRVRVEAADLRIQIVHVQRRCVGSSSAKTSPSSVELLPGLFRERTGASGRWHTTAQRHGGANRAPINAFCINLVPLHGNRWRSRWRLPSTAGVARAPAGSSNDGDL